LRTLPARHPALWFGRAGRAPRADSNPRARARRAPQVASLPAQGTQFAEWSATGAFLVTAFRAAKPAEGQAPAKNVQVGPGGGGWGRAPQTRGAQGPAGVQGPRPPAAGAAVARAGDAAAPGGSVPG
jgi:hypothetical protein